MRRVQQDIVPYRCRAQQSVGGECEKYVNYHESNRMSHYLIARYVQRRLMRWISLRISKQLGLILTMIAGFQDTGVAKACAEHPHSVTALALTTAGLNLNLNLNLTTNC